MPLQIFPGGQDAVKYGVLARRRGVSDSAGFLPGASVHGRSGNHGRRNREPAVHQGGLRFCARGISSAEAVREGAVAGGGMLIISCCGRHLLDGFPVSSSQQAHKTNGNAFIPAGNESKSMMLAPMEP